MGARASCRRAGSWCASARVASSSGLSDRSRSPRRWRRWWRSADAHRVFWAGREAAARRPTENLPKSRAALRPTLPRRHSEPFARLICKFRVPHCVCAAAGGRTPTDTGTHRAPIRQSRCRHFRVSTLIALIARDTHANIF